MSPSGTQLSQSYFEQVVRPVVEARWPGMPYAAARLGSGSEVLGLDDERSRDHDWGLRLDLLVPADRVAQVDAHLDEVLPETFAGHPVRFPTTWDPSIRHRVQVSTARDLALARLGVDATGDLGVTEWLTLTGQAVLELTAGKVFVDHTGQLDGIRRRLAWYPDDLWRHLVATDWARLAQELPFVGRTGERGDDLGSRVVAARLAGIALHLGHLLERCWPPYAKWLGTSFAQLPRAGVAATSLESALGAADWQGREDGLVSALRQLSAVQADAGLPAVDDPVGPFWDRPFRGVRDSAVTVLAERITDPVVRALPRGVGAVEQWSDNVDVLTRPALRRAPRGSSGG
ncbi:DUF4037 domain-containing protein [Terrabacter sp. NPDC080008]|uniref:DUF4037 domain-containing protein n=1 Tax=Terrabacter sp. NPDC080008 TaxID=3155176 RepID=UPI00344F38ED